MERKVIKINLMGAIFTVILIIAVIIGVIIAINKFIENLDNNSQKENNIQIHANLLTFQENMIQC